MSEAKHTTTLAKSNSHIKADCVVCLPDGEGCTLRKLSNATKAKSDASLFYKEFASLMLFLVTPPLPSPRGEGFCDAKALIFAYRREVGVLIRSLS